MSESIECIFVTRLFYYKYYAVIYYYDYVFFLRNPFQVGRGAELLEACIFV